MTNATVRFTIDTSSLREACQTASRELKLFGLQFARMKAIRRERRAYLNMLRSTRKNRKDKVRKWLLLKLHVKAAEMRIEKPNAEIRIVSRNLRRGEPVVMIDAEYERIEPETTDA